MTWLRDLAFVISIMAPRRSIPEADDSLTRMAARQPPLPIDDCRISA
jgi:hypothetical protein